MEKWINEVWSKIEKKLSHTNETVGSSIFPYTTDENGRFKPSPNEGISWWTNGFWPGIQWLMYSETGKECYKKVANELEDKLDEALYGFDGLHHDVGFMWLISAGANYRLTANEMSKRRSLIAANFLAGRYNPVGNFIRAWNDDKIGWAIIDCMMNLPLLYWASEETGDPRFSQIAQNHANTAMNTFVRPDGSVNHINVYDPYTGEFLETLTGQGYGVGSSWTRGQAWGIYGFVLSYIHTQKQEYLDTAKRIAHYFISALGDDFVPPCDFRSPKEPVYKDTTAGAVAACGLLEIANAVGDAEGAMYKDAAIKILKAMEDRCCDWTEDNDAILHMGTEAYEFGGKNIPIIYGDFFFIEAILKLKGSKFLPW